MKRRPKRKFSKTLAKMDIFENDTVGYSCDRVKMDVFDNDDVTLSVPVFFVQLIIFISRSKMADTRFTVLSFVRGLI